MVPHTQQLSPCMALVCNLVLSEKALDLEVGRLDAGILGGGHQAPISVGICHGVKSVLLRQTWSEMITYSFVFIGCRLALRKTRRNVRG